MSDKMSGQLCNRICILLLIGVGVSVAVIVAIGSGASAATAGHHQVEAPKSNKIFNFNQYKRTFGKHYKSFLEELSRKRLYLASALCAFLSNIKYKYRISPYYLAVNNLSDRSPEERDRMRNKYVGLDESEHGTPTDDQTEPPLDNSDSSLQVELIPSESLENVEKELESLAMEHSDSEPGYKELREALAGEPPGQSRKKRDIGLTRQQEKLKWHRSKPAMQSIREELRDSLSSIRAIVGKKDRSSSGANEVELKLADDEVFFDHRDSGCLLPPRDQGQCASCYAFASMAMMEWLHCKKTGKLVAFSEQYMIDCGAEQYDELLFGCRGGNRRGVAKFIHNFGLELSSNYGYKAALGKCPYPEKFDLKRTGSIRMELANAFKLERDQLGDYLEHSPIYIGIVADTEFDAYGGGVDNGARCKQEANHAMLLVGHGRQDNTEYWLMRNSFGTNWGLGGYYKLAKSATKKCLKKSAYIFGTEDGEHLSVEPRETN